MDLKDLLLTKEELPLFPSSSFVLPIHPLLLDPRNQFREEFAYQAFKDTIPDWYEDLTKLSKDPNFSSEEERTWYEDVFLKKEPAWGSRYGMLFVDPIGWENNVDFMQNGFVRSICISRNHGGTIYFLNESGESEILVPLGTDLRIPRMPEEKLKDFSFEVDEKGKYSKMYTYQMHNVDHVPGALFLRNWGINYMNSCFRSRA